jgi:hypothetical protein
MVRINTFTTGASQGCSTAFARPSNICASIGFAPLSRECCGRSGSPKNCQLLDVRFVLDDRRRANKSDTIALEPEKFDDQRWGTRARPRGLRAETEKEARWLQVPERRSRAQLRARRLVRIAWFQAGKAH